MAACAHGAGTIAKRDGGGLLNVCACCGGRVFIVPADALDDLYEAAEPVLAHGEGPELEALGKAMGRFAAVVS
jgi:hypothetical protein